MILITLIASIAVSGSLSNYGDNSVHWLFNHKKDFKETISKRHNFMFIKYYKIDLFIYISVLSVCMYESFCFPRLLGKNLQRKT